jgi:hypothetical protein
MNEFDGALHPAIEYSIHHTSPISFSSIEQMKLKTRARQNRDSDGQHLIISPSF